MYDILIRPGPPPRRVYLQLNLMLLGQDTLEGIFHQQLAKLGCVVEKGTELLSFEQNKNYVEVKLCKRGPEGLREEYETERYEWMVGTDGAKGVVRKQLGLSFLGETRKVENFVVGDICVEGLSRKVCQAFFVISSFAIPPSSGVFRVLTALGSSGTCGATHPMFCESSLLAFSSAASTV